jgi:dienelactone hydrolase
MKTSFATIALSCLLFSCLAARADTSESPSSGIPRIQITPNPVFIDQPVKIVLQDFPARQLVAVQVLMINRTELWQSHAEFLTDRHGNADLATQAPQSGTYQHADPAGLFWSQSLIGTNTAFTNMPARKSFEPWRYKITASVNAHTIATATMERFILCPGVKQIELRDHGLRGTLFLPAGKGPWPAVIVLGGSGGGLWASPAAFLAAKGYAALALAYFNYEDLPTSLENIPLEYFQTAVHWLQARDDTRSNSIAVFGVSRGGELSLLLGATFPEVHAVVAISPSSVLWGGLGTDANSYRVPAWTYQGKSLPFIDGRLSDEQWEKVSRILKQNPLDNVPLFQAYLDDQATVARASIPVEKIDGPVLLISGNDDQLWPSTEMADMVMRRLNQARHPFPDLHLAYSGAGHGLPFPNMPTTVNVIVHPVTKDKLSLGGDPEHSAAAAADAWPRIIDFLNKSFNLGRQ